MSLASFNALIERQLAVAEKADPHACSRCGRYLDRWYYGFPLPLCCSCVDADHWGSCPVCHWTCRQDPSGSGILAAHGPAKGPFPGPPCPGSGKRMATADQMAAVMAAGEKE